MMNTIANSEITSTIGFFLTLTSLLGTYFYVHLSTWFRELLELNSKWEENSVGMEEFRRRARTECRFQLKRQLNHVPILISGILTAFIISMAVISNKLIASVSPRPVILDYYITAFIIFFITYIALTAYFLIHGYIIAFKLRSAINNYQNSNG
jgi:hypothetical protein